MYFLYRSDPATSGWVSTWMSGLALSSLGICLVGGAIFAVFWARRNKRIMKASYPGIHFQNICLCFSNQR